MAINHKANKKYLPFPTAYLGYPIVPTIALARAMYLIELLSPSKKVKSTRNSIF